MNQKLSSKISMDGFGFNPGGQSDPFNKVLRDNRLRHGPEDTGPSARYTMEPIFVPQLLSSGEAVRSAKVLCSARPFQRKGR
ncbi:hypothetical protein TNIN_360401 [Trichonephila inaurata madagascariensis]|uniref:Uncharacterized protein n=1 Tax=Trichonephila inaurata madagascariensis TaxID=2747483 RepID=A0A8X6M9U0_9ARAC|nr:hypothetical protein TNIN_360401 [Trichonephila inaurata madagascariensis]